MQESTETAKTTSVPVNYQAWVGLGCGVLAYILPMALTIFPAFVFGGVGLLEVKRCGDRGLYPSIGGLGLATIAALTLVYL